MGNELPKAVIFGAGAVARNMLPQVGKEYSVIGFTDNDPKLWGGGVEGLPVIPPNEVRYGEIDAIVICSLTGLKQIPLQLREMGVDSWKIVTKFVQTQVEARILFLESFGLMCKEAGIKGAVAEGGVYQGDFEKEVNRVFPDRKLYLFDTFEGYNADDIAKNKDRGYSDFVEGRLSNTSVELVLKKMPHPKMCVIEKGYFPESARGLENEVFAFVNLDFNLYEPMYSGLDFFAPRMSKGGVILLHDYFVEQFKEVKQAVADYCAKRGLLRLFPIGDGISMGIGFW